MEYNVYCDESCYMENDDSNIMAIGGIWCPKEKIREINARIKEIKQKYNVNPKSEIKWTKVTPAKKNLYIDLINFFFDYKDLHFRIIIIDKTTLNHERYHQTHEDFYYKSYFQMLSFIFDKNQQYNVYVDIKDTHSNAKCLKLQEVCCNKKYDFSHRLITKIQPIRSHESNILQLADVLIGAITFANRKFPKDEFRSEAKKEIIEKIKERSDYKLTKTTYLTERKFNIFFWEGSN